MSWEMVEKFRAEYQEAWDRAANAMSELQTVLRVLLRDAAEKPVQRVVLASPMQAVSLSFEIDKEPVSYEDYKRVMGSTTSAGPDSHGFARGMTWHEAQAFAHLVGKRLPTAQEWVAGVQEWYDLWEWTATPQDTYYVLQGGSWVTSSPGPPAAQRNVDSPGFRGHRIGFRCARDLR